MMIIHTACILSDSSKLLTSSSLHRGKEKKMKKMLTESDVGVAHHIKCDWKATASSIHTNGGSLEKVKNRANKFLLWGHHVKA